MSFFVSKSIENLLDEKSFLSDEINNENNYLIYECEKPNLEKVLFKVKNISFMQDNVKIIIESPIKNFEMLFFKDCIP